MFAPRHVLLVAILLAIVLGRSLLAEPFLLAGRSMHPTFRSLDYVIVEKVSARLFGYERGDVVLFREPSTAVKGLKRIVGLPGETVCVSSTGISVTQRAAVVWRRALEARSAEWTTESCRRLELGSDEYFLLGDHWVTSIDSRHFGPVSRSAIVGKALLRLFPHPSFLETPALADAGVGAVRDIRPGVHGGFEVGGQPRVNRGDPAHRAADGSSRIDPRTLAVRRGNPRASSQAEGTERLI